MYLCVNVCIFEGRRIPPASLMKHLIMHTRHIDANTFSHKQFKSGKITTVLPLLFFLAYDLNSHILRNET